MTVSAEDFRSGMRQLAAAVNVITARNQGQRAGMVATAVVSLTADPPQIGIAVNRGNASFPVIGDSGCFAVNVLRHDQLEVAQTFSGMRGLRGEERFGVGAWDELVTGAPILSGSAASFDCRVVQQAEFSSHVLFVGQVEAVKVAPSAVPLLYMDGDWASLARPQRVDFSRYEGMVMRVADALEAARAAPESPPARLRAFVRAFVALHAAEPELPRGFFAHEVFAPAERLEAINGHKRRVEAGLRDLLAQGAEEGTFSLSDPALTAEAMIGMLNGIQRLPSGQSLKGLEDRLADLALAMVTPGAPHHR